MELTRSWLLGAYVLACGWLDPRLPPQLDSRLRLPELLFVPLALLCLPLVKPTRLGVLGLALAVFLGTRAISAAVHGDWGEFAGNLYLAAVAVTVQGFVRAYGPRALHLSFLGLGLTSTALAAVGWLTRSDLLTRVFPHYPYLGEVPRATALSGHPNMLASLLAVCLLVTRSRWPSAVMAGGLVLTLSKTILWLAVALLARTRRGVPLALGLLVLALVGTHWLVPSPELVTWSQCEPYAPGTRVVPSIYLVTKRTALVGFARSPLVGVGPFSPFVAAESEAGRYGLRQFFDPHCTYTGVAAEHGLLGLVGLGALAAALIVLLRRQSEDWWKALFLFFALEALVTDELNFRHFWLAVGWLAA